MIASKIEDLNVEELVALLFLVGKCDSILRFSEQELLDLVIDPVFLTEWRNARNRLKNLVKYYPDQEEEKHYFVAMLDAVHRVDPYSEETEDLMGQLLPLVERLIKIP